jgi:hypothetical protein
MDRFVPRDDSANVMDRFVPLDDRFFPWIASFYEMTEFPSWRGAQRRGHPLMRSLGKCNAMLAVTNCIET